MLYSCACRHTGLLSNLSDFLNMANSMTLLEFVWIRHILEWLILKQLIVIVWRRYIQSFTGSVLGYTSDVFGGRNQPLQSIHHGVAAC